MSGCHVRWSPHRCNLGDNDASQRQPPAILGTGCQGQMGGTTARIDEACRIQCGRNPRTSLLPSPFLDCKRVDVVACRMGHWSGPCCPSCCPPWDPPT
jgi:hypothetical protein